MVSELRRVNRVEVVKERTVINADAAAVIDALGSPPVDLGSDAEIAPEDQIAAKAGIETTAERHRVLRTARGTGSGREDRADACGRVNSLGVGQVRGRG